MLLARDRLDGISPVAILLADLEQNPSVRNARSLEPLKRILQCVLLGCGVDNVITGIGLS